MTARKFGLRLGLVAVLLLGYFFVEPPLPKFYPGDVVAHQGYRFSLLQIIETNAPMPTLAISNGRLQLVDWEYLAGVYGLELTTFKRESELALVPPHVITEFALANARARAQHDAILSAREKDETESLKSAMLPSPPPDETELKWR